MSDSKDYEPIYRLRHSASHILAQAVLDLYPGTKLAIGPVIDEGFYYDFEASVPFQEEDLPKIEKRMREIVAENQAFSQWSVDKDEARKFFRERNEPYKLEIIEGIEGGRVNFVQNGPFTDLCEGGHLRNSGELKAFKLLSVTGAYWRGNENNPMLQRIYGTAFMSQKDLDAYLKQREEAQKRDHRKVGKQLELFSFHEEGPGLPFWKPKGLILKNLLIQFMREKLDTYGYVEIETPTMLRERLWQTSGHTDNYRENMFFLERDEEVYAVKPMNCPGGMLVYLEDKHSYRELPLKVAEFGKVHRYERSGVLSGLFRVRGFTQDDAHIFTTPEQLAASVAETIRYTDEVYKTFGFDYHIELSTRPPKSIGSDEQWRIATEGLRSALDELKLPYKVNEADGAFYGPKIDFHLKDAIGRTLQCGTIQLDMNLPERFDLNYVGEDGKEHRVIMLHRAIFGSLERFIGILIEHYAGAFPVWLSPVQVRVATIAERHTAVAEKVIARLKREGLRVDADFRSEKIGYKVREAELMKIPYLFVIGDKEAEAERVAVRTRGKRDLGSQTLDEILARIKREISDKQ
ncbi:MAG TPA: threonine--tRNA ligase [Candidatus Omnitrophota bacterium]|jgi:threonyl-tRNA synthetase|nr:threonine--tRNA ligase [Candidatus Omnitrophota bacterium]HQB93858.1 threonine--tRNA ligase [Candidatus Omnitrophota bacterium]